MSQLERTEFFLPFSNHLETTESAKPQIPVEKPRRRVVPDIADPRRLPTPREPRRRSDPSRTPTPRLPVPAR